MPPEALVNPPRYSNKLDCFSHGVLTIQIVTREFPNPTDATTTVEDLRSPTGIMHMPVPESERRKNDIDLVDPTDPLLPLALHCLKDRDTERPSADELCGRLATLKGEQMYTRSVEQSREQSASVWTLQEELARARSNQQQVQLDLERARTNHQQVQDELERARDKHETELYECHTTFRQVIQEKDEKLARASADYHQLVQGSEGELERVRAKHETEIATLQSAIEQLRMDNLHLSQKQERLMKESHVSTWVTTLIDNYKLHSPLKKCSRSLQKKKKQAHEKGNFLNLYAFFSIQFTQVMKTDPVKLTWRQGRIAPEVMSAFSGAAAVHGNTAYFSRGYNVYSYTLASDEWTKLPPCEYEDSGLAVVKKKVTTIGGLSDGRTINNLVSWHEGWFRWGTGWRGLLPPMPTARVRPATVTTPTHLIVSAGMTQLNGYGLPTIEILDTNTNQWSSASSSPKALRYPHMSLCGEHLYLSENNKIFACSVEELLKSCKPASTNRSDGGSVWTKLADIPVHYWTSVTTLRGQVLAIGGRNRTQTGAIHQYSRNTNSWSFVGEMPTPRADPLVAVLPSNELIAVGGKDGAGRYCNITEIASTD